MQGTMKLNYGGSAGNKAKSYYKPRDEKGIQNSILDYLQFVPGRFWQNDNTGIYDPVRGIYLTPNKKYKPDGVSDILGYYKSGRFTAIEVKDPEDYKYLMKNYEKLKSSLWYPDEKRQLHLQNQILFIEDVVKKGGIGFFACSIDMVKEYFDKLK